MSHPPAIVTCALTGVLTDPARHRVPVTPTEMARSAREAFDAGATIVHVHFRDQDPGRGHLPSWAPEVAHQTCQAIREACPGILINMSTGVIGDDISGPLACLETVEPEIAACNAGSLNYLKTRRDGSWAWPPMLFDNPVQKVARFCAAMTKLGTRPEFECFDVGIVRSIGMYVDAGVTAVSRPQYNFVMGVASGMPADPSLLELLVGYRRAGCPWQVTAIGREEIWPLHAKAAELGGHLRTGLEDTFYLPDGTKTASNGALVAALVDIARAQGRDIATTAQARSALLA